MNIIRINSRSFFHISYNRLQWIVNQENSLFDIAFELYLLFTLLVLYHPLQSPTHIEYSKSNGVNPNTQQFIVIGTRLGNQKVRETTL